jgi:PAS domain S-box-containing protein
MKIKNKMNFRDKTKDELIKGLQKLHKVYYSLKTSYEKDITERKLAEETLLESEVCYRELFNNISSGVAIYEVTNSGNDFIFKDLNRAGERIDGNRKEDIIGRSIYQVRPGINKFGLLEVFRRVFATGIPEHYPARFYMDERLQGWYDNFVYRLPSGEIVAVYDDITERKQVEEAHKINEALFRELYDNMKSGSVIFTVINDGSKGSDYIIEKFNRVGLKMEGKTLEEVVGKRFIDIRPNIDNYGLIPLMKKVWETGESGTLPIRIYKDEHYSNYYENYVFKIPSGEVVTLYDDVTESKRSEEALRLEKENFRHSLDDSPLGVRIATIEGNTIYANKTLLNFYGYDSLGELQKTPLKSRYSPESYAEAQKRKHQRKRGDFSVTDYEISIVRKNGEIRHLQVFRKDVLWDGVRQFQIVYNDITDRKLAEEEISKSKKLLETLNKHLIDIRENERTQIAMNLHDDIGQKLTAINLDIAWLKSRMGVQSLVVRKKFKDMSLMINETIEGIKEISSFLRPAILFDLGLVPAINAQLGGFEKQSGIKCHFYCEPEKFIIDDRLSLILYRILQESFTNIARHSGASTAEVKLRILKNKIEMLIKDNGIGIDKDKVSSITSMGIAGIKERIRSVNGRLSISGEKGSGTIIKVFIPLTKREEP